jgi:hypothetical protein
MRRAAALAVLGAALTGCVAALSSADVASLRDAEQLDLLIYSEVPSGEARAVARASFCATAAVLRRNDATAFDTKGAIECEATK